MLVGQSFLILTLAQKRASAARLALSIDSYRALIGYPGKRRPRL